MMDSHPPIFFGPVQLKAYFFNAINTYETGGHEDDRSAHGRVYSCVEKIRAT